MHILPPHTHFLQASSRIVAITTASCIKLIILEQNHFEKVACYVTFPAKISKKWTFTSGKLFVKVKEKITQFLLLLHVRKLLGIF